MQMQWRSQEGGGPDLLYNDYLLEELECKISLKHLYIWFQEEWI